MYCATSARILNPCILYYTTIWFIILSFFTHSATWDTVRSIKSFISCFLYNLNTCKRFLTFYENGPIVVILHIMPLQLTWLIWPIRTILQTTLRTIWGTAWTRCDVTLGVSFFCSYFLLPIVFWFFLNMWQSDRPTSKNLQYIFFKSNLRLISSCQLLEKSLILNSLLYGTKRVLVSAFVTAERCIHH